MSCSVKCASFAVMGGTLVMLASTIHKVAKYNPRPKWSSNIIRILQMEFEFEKNEFNIPEHKFNFWRIVFGDV